MSETKPAFTEAEYNARVAKTRAAMAKAGVEVLIVADPSNMGWLTGYDGWSFSVHQAVLVLPDGEPLWFGRPHDNAGTKHTTNHRPDTKCSYPDSYVQNPAVHPYQVLSGVLRDKGHAAARIGVEMDNYYFSAKCLETLRAELPQARIADATALVNWQRAVKSEQELAYMRKAARIVEAMHARVREVADVVMR